MTTKNEKELEYVFNEGAALSSQDQHDWVKKYAQTEAGSLKHSIAAEHLMEMGIIPEQGKRITTDKDYDKFWTLFKKNQ